MYRHSEKISIPKKSASLSLASRIDAPIKIMEGAVSRLTHKSPPYQRLIYVVPSAIALGPQSPVQQAAQDISRKGMLHDSEVAQLKGVQEFVSVLRLIAGSKLEGGAWAPTATSLLQKLAAGEWSGVLSEAPVPLEPAQMRAWQMPSWGYFPATWPMRTIAAHWSDLLHYKLILASAQDLFVLSVFAKESPAAAKLLKDSLVVLDDAPMADIVVKKTVEIQLSPAFVAQQGHAAGILDEEGSTRLASAQHEGSSPRTQTMVLHRLAQTVKEACKAGAAPSMSSSEPTLRAWDGFLEGCARAFVVSRLSGLRPAMGGVSQQEARGPWTLFIASKSSVLPELLKGSIVTQIRYKASLSSSQTTPATAIPMKFAPNKGELPHFWEEAGRSIADELAGVTGKSVIVCSSLQEAKTYESILLKTQGEMEVVNAEDFSKGWGPFLRWAQDEPLGRPSVLILTAYEGMLALAPLPACKKVIVSTLADVPPACAAEAWLEREVGRNYMNQRQLPLAAQHIGRVVSSARNALDLGAQLVFLDPRLHQLAFGRRVASRAQLSVVLR